MSDIVFLFWEIIKGTEQVSNILAGGLLIDLF